MTLDTPTKDFGTSVVRTIVLPAFLTVAAKIGLDFTGVDNETLEFVLSVGAGYLGYAVVRALEVYVSPKWGYILGLSKNTAPTYKE